jgi:Mce-associated membrane protein
LIDDVLIPAAKQRSISAVATVPAVAVMSATAEHAVVLVFINQTTIIDTQAPINSASSVRVTLAKVGSQWLVSDFSPPV